MASRRDIFATCKGSPECVPQPVTLRYLDFIAEITFFLKAYVSVGFRNIENGLLSRNKLSTTRFHCAYKKKIV